MRTMCMIILCVLGAVVSMAYADQDLPSSDLAYRQSVREDLVLESRSKKDFSRRNPNQYSRDPKDYFVIGEGSPFELEPTGVSSGSVVGA